MQEYNIYCTLFDSNYLSRGLALHKSLSSTCPDFHLYVLAFDDLSATILNQLDLDNCTIVTLPDFESNDLKLIKRTRTATEYCWTCASHFTRYCLQTFDIKMCTYLDADMYFYRDPSVIFEENVNASVYITRHNYTPKYDISKSSGIYCVQFVSFKNDSRGLHVLNWWCDACLEWCYNRHENGKFGDQKYLDDWPERFQGVHVVQNLGAGLAIWNIQQYAIMNGNEDALPRLIKDELIFSPIFYHFHYLKFYHNNTVELGRKEISRDFMNMFYIPYLKNLLKEGALVKGCNSNLDPQGTRKYPKGLKHLLISAWRKLNGTFNIYHLSKIIENA